MEIVPSNFTVSDYCHALKRNDISVNRDYQRSDKVWPSPAKSFLIETILLGFPLPKISLHQKVDIKSRKTIKEIVDGQQRSSAILDFFDDKFALSKTLETVAVAGKKYSALPDEFQERFLNYSLSVDIFVGVTPDEIREVFRRINSYTIPLNPEEARHAKFQGSFKWFIYGLSKKYDAVFLGARVFTEKQVVRMADAKLLTEICHALDGGIRTTKSVNLDNIYKKFDDQFDQEARFQGRLERALRFLEALSELHGSALMKPHLVYTLLLAVIHVTEPVESLQVDFPLARGTGVERDVALEKLSELATVIESGEDSDSGFYSFLSACSSKTNVDTNRRTRFIWFCNALQGRLQG